MQSNYNDKNTRNNYKINNINKDEILINNKEIIDTLILENSQKRDKSFISVKEIEIMKEYENNLLKLLEDCPPKLLSTLIQDTSSLDSFKNTSGKTA